MSNKSTESPQNSERREFFRVDSDVVFDVQPVDSATAQSEDAMAVKHEGPGWHVLEALSAMDQQLQTSTRALANKQPEVCRHIELLNQKVDMIARHTVLETYQHLPRTRISLSNDGVAFKSPRILYMNSYVVTRIIFLPNFAPVVTFAQIIRCESRDNGFNVAAKFHRISPEAQQCVSRMLIKAQQRAN